MGQYFSIQNGAQAAPPAQFDRGAIIEPRRSGGTGRRTGLKIRRPSGRVGSIPTFGISTASKEQQAMRIGILTGGGDVPGKPMFLY